MSLASVQFVLKYDSIPNRRYGNTVLHYGYKTIEEQKMKDITKAGVLTRPCLCCFVLYVFVPIPLRIPCWRGYHFTYSTDSLLKSSTMLRPSSMARWRIRSYSPKEMASVRHTSGEGRRGRCFNVDLFRVRVLFASFWWLQAVPGLDLPFGSPG